MRAHVIENSRVVNTILVDRLDLLPNLVDAVYGGAIGDFYDANTNTFTPPPPPPPAIPFEVTMRQARLALLQAGKLSLVDPAIDAMPEPQKSAARIEWEYSNTVQRANPFVAVLGVAIGMTPAEMDQLFITAATL